MSKHHHLHEAEPVEAVEAAPVETFSAPSEADAVSAQRIAETDKEARKAERKAEQKAAKEKAEADRLAARAEYAQQMALITARNAREREESRLAWEKKRAEQRDEQNRVKAERAAKRASKGTGVKAPRPITDPNAPLQPGQRRTAMPKATHLHYVAGSTDKVDRRPGSFGEVSLNIIKRAGDTGLTYGEFLLQGGRSSDLRWDIDRGRVKADISHLLKEHESKSESESSAEEIAEAAASEGLTEEERQIEREMQDEAAE